MSAVEEGLEEVGEFAGDVVESVGDFVEDAAGEVVNAVERVIDVAETVVENYGTAIVLTALGVPAPIAAGANTLVNGGTAEDALKAAGTVYLAGEIRAGVSGAVVASGGSATLAAAAGSAAASSVSTALSGGSAEDILKAGAIGGVSSVVGTNVAGQYGDTAGAIAAGVTRDVLLERDGVDILINAGFTAANNAANNYAANGGDVRTDIRNEIAASGGGEVTEDTAITYPGSVMFDGGDGSTQYAGVDTGTRTDAGVDGGRLKVETFGVGGPPEGETATNVVEPPKLSPGDFVGDPSLRMVVDENYNIVDADTGEQIVIGDRAYSVPEDQRRLKIDITVGGSGNIRPEDIESRVLSVDGQPRESTFTRIADLRKFGGAEGGPYEALVGGSGYATKEGGVLPFSFFGKDAVTGDDKYFIFDKVYTAVVLPNNDVVLKSNTTNEVFYPTLTQDNKLVLNPSKVDISTGEVVMPESVQQAVEAGGAAGGKETGGRITSDREVSDQVQRFLDEIEQAETDAQAARAREQFIKSQQDRLAGRISGETMSRIDAEISALISQYERAKEEAERGRGSIERIREEALTGIIGDVDRTTGTGGTGGTKDTGGGTSTGTGTGSGTGTGAGTGTGTGVGAGTGEGEGIGSGTGPGMGDGTGGGIGGGTGGGVGEGGGVTDETTTPDRGIPTSVTLTTPEQRFVSTVSPRVTGEALAGILGAKKPLFGGDEDQQRAIWNRRSLRLRRALGL